MEAMMPYVWAFFVGGGFCVVAQVLIDRTKLTPARILVCYVVAGATTPLTGFGNLIARGVRRAVDEKGLLGALTGGLTAAAGGTAAALCFGYLAALIFHGRPKG